MFDITDLSDSLLYVESDRWHCDFGHGKPVMLGLVLEAVDLGGIDGHSFVIDASLVPQPECLNEEVMEQAKAECAPTRRELIRYVYECYGGVPVNIDALQPVKASCGFSSFVADSSIGSLKDESGEEMEVRHFQNLADAMHFAREFYAANAGVLFEFIDFVLDRPLRSGGTGWDKIRLITKK